MFDLFSNSPKKGRDPWVSLLNQPLGHVVPLRGQIFVSRTPPPPPSLLPPCVHPRKTLPCLRPKRPCVYRHHAHMLSILVDLGALYTCLCRVATHFPVSFLLFFFFVSCCNLTEFWRRHRHIRTLVRDSHELSICPWNLLEFVHQKLRTKTVPNSSH